MVPRYKYLHIADAIAAQIKSGELAPGERIPSEIELAEAHGVARLTARQAIIELRARGLVTTLPGIGSFVAER